MYCLLFFSNNIVSTNNSYYPSVEKVFVTHYAKTNHMVANNFCSSFAGSIGFFERATQLLIMTLCVSVTILSRDILLRVKGAHGTGYLCNVLYLLTSGSVEVLLNKGSKSKN